MRFIVCSVMDHWCTEGVLKLFAWVFFNVFHGSTTSKCCGLSVGAVVCFSSRVVGRVEMRGSKREERSCLLNVRNGAGTRFKHCHHRDIRFELRDVCHIDRWFDSTLLIWWKTYQVHRCYILGEKMRRRENFVLEMNLTLSLSDVIVTNLEWNF